MLWYPRYHDLDSHTPEIQVRGLCSYLPKFCWIEELGTWWLWWLMAIDGYYIGIVLTYGTSPLLLQQSWLTQTLGFSVICSGYVWGSTWLDWETPGGLVKCRPVGTCKAFPDTARSPWLWPHAQIKPLMDSWHDSIAGRQWKAEDKWPGDLLLLKAVIGKPLAQVSSCMLFSTCWSLRELLCFTMPFLPWWTCASDMAK